MPDSGPLRPSDPPQSAPHPPTEPPDDDAPGYSALAMLAEAADRGLVTDGSMPVIGDLIGPLGRASRHFLQIIQSQDPKYLETLMHHSFRYLFGKAVEATLLWSRSPDGRIELDLQPADMARERIVTALPAEIQAIVESVQDEAEPYFAAHRAAMVANHDRMDPEAFVREIGEALDLLPEIGMAFAIQQEYHELQW